MQWDREKTLLFIDKYREKPILWDPRHEDHYNKLKKNDAWRELADEMEIDVEECKKKITSLLASLRREKAKTKKSSGTGKGADEVYTSTWFAYKPLQFVLDRNIPRPTEDTIQESTSDIQENSDGTQRQAAMQVSEINEVTNVPKSSDIVQKSKKRKQGNSDEIMTSAFNILKATSERNQSVNRAPRSTDECDTYGDFIANKLRLYTPCTRSYVQHHFADILFNADRGHYEYEHTYQNYNQHSQQAHRYTTLGTYSTTPSPASSNAHYSGMNNSQQGPNSSHQAMGYPHTTTPSPAASPANYFATDNSQQAMVNSQQAVDNSQQAIGYSHSTTPRPASSHGHYSGMDKSHQGTGSSHQTTRYSERIAPSPAASSANYFAMANSQKSVDSSQQAIGYSPQAPVSPASLHSHISDDLTDDFNDLLH